MNDAGQDLAVSRVGSILVLRIDRESRLGALSSELIDRLRAEFHAVEEDPSISVVIITGTGKAFVAGADIAEYRDVTVESFTDYQYRSRLLFDGIAALDRPVIAAVNGYALGGGFELALACDLIVASRTAQFGLPEVKLGLVPGGGGPQRLSRRTSASFAKEVTMIGRLISGEEALHRGIVSRLAEPESLMAEATALARDLAGLPWRAVRRVKSLVDTGFALPLDEALTADQEALIELFLSEDAREGIAAFLDKRPARFRGPGDSTRSENDG